MILFIPISLALMLLSCFIGVAVSNGSKPTVKEDTSYNTEIVQNKSATDVGVLRIGSDLTIPFANGEVIVNI